MGALEEFRSAGRLGPMGAGLLYETVAAVARFGRLPPPEGHSRWNPEAVAEVAHDFLTGPRIQERLTHLYLLATNETSFERLLESAVRNHLRSQARRTERGRLIRRLQDILEGDDAFAQVLAGQPGMGNWILRKWGRADPWAGSLDDLTAAGWAAVGIRLSRWRANARRRGPISDRASLVAFCRAVLEAAQGSLPLQTIAEVAAHRFALAAPPMIESLDALEFEVEVVTMGSSVDPGTSRLQAEEIWKQLTLRERLLLRHLQEPVRSVAEAVGLGKSATAEAMARLREILRVALEGEEDAEAIIRHLTKMAETLVRGRTGGDSSAF
ncbi:MAG: hypothetical protein ACRDJG_04980 [Actinomycetota bacterium]